jgi:GDPmannose 4,6-dehydratase
LAKSALILGISGQDGALLARLLLAKSYVVHGTSRDAQMTSFGNLRTVGVLDQVTLHSAVPTDFRSVLQGNVAGRAGRNLFACRSKLGRVVV